MVSLVAVCGAGPCRPQSSRLARQKRPAGSPRIRSDQCRLGLALTWTKAHVDGPCSSSHAGRQGQHEPRSRKLPPKGAPFPILASHCPTIEIVPIRVFCPFHLWPGANMRPTWQSQRPWPGFTSFSSIALAGSRHICCSTFLALHVLAVAHASEGSRRSSQPAASRPARLGRGRCICHRSAAPAPWCFLDLCGIGGHGLACKRHRAIRSLNPCPEGQG